MLQVAAIDRPGGRWTVEVRTPRQAQKVARHLRWRKGWPTWIYKFEQPADSRSRRWVSHLTRGDRHEAWPSLEAEGGPDGPDGDPRGLGDGEPEPIALLEGLRFLNRHDYRARLAGDNDQLRPFRSPGPAPFQEHGGAGAHHGDDGGEDVRAAADVRHFSEDRALWRVRDGPARLNHAPGQSADLRVRGGGTAHDDEDGDV
jgi:hypothetical protein